MNWLYHISFGDKWVLWFLLLIPFLVVIHIYYHRKKQNSLILSSFDNFPEYKKTTRQKLSFLPILFKLTAIALIIITLARPQSSSGGQNVTTEGIDIVMALDISASMLAEDLKPNRIDAAKKVAQQFIDNRPTDRIGLVIFSGESFTQCPITSDHAVIKNLMAGIESGMLSDGTAIGEGLATAVNRIKGSKSKSKVIILLTDGVNNVGAVDPLTAGDIAKAFNVRVYTIGVGSQGMAPYPFKTPFGIQYQNVPVQIDEDVLKQIAAETGGKYFRATNTAKLKEVYNEIDKMEKTKISVTEFHNKSEEFYPLILLAIGLLALEILLKHTLLKSLP
jgi:Ca-activated chloride channel family protein